MRAGLDADDMYIMVEDEFLATAQLYTAHLHHAEYQRLKALSRNRNVKSPDITRPVSGPALRDETRKRKAAEARAKGINEGLDPILSKERTNVEADEESDFEIERDDPWKGTQLHQFMTVSPRKERGLVGLQGMISETRAAAGFAAPERTGVGTPTKPKSSSRTSTNKVLDEDPENDDDDDDDDLDAPVARAPSQPPSKVTFTATRRETSHKGPQEGADPQAPLGKSILDRPQKKSKPLKPPQKRSFLDMNPFPKTIKPPSTPPRSIKREPPNTYVKTEPGNPSTLSPKTDRILQRLKAKREKDEKERKRGFGGGATGLNGIPIF